MNRFKQRVQAYKDNKMLLTLSDRTWYRGGRKAHRAMIRFKIAIKMRFENVCTS